jgi:predicted permease
MAVQQLPYVILHAFYIILGEFGTAILLALLAKRVSEGTWTSSILAGLAGGVGIFVCYALAYGITDGLIP